MSTPEPPGRGCIRAQSMPGGFILLCDCGHTTEVLVEVGLDPPEVSEIAITCEGCRTSHWVTLTFRARHGG